MGSPGLPQSLASTFPDSEQDDSIRLHQEHHDAVHRIVNRFDTRLGSAAVGDLLAWNGSVYYPRGPGVRINLRSESAYTLALSDAANVLVALSSSTPVSLTVPSDASVAFPVGSQIHLAQLGSGQVTVVPASGVVVNASPGLKLLDQYSGAELIKVSANRWWAVGRLTA